MRLRRYSVDSGVANQKMDHGKVTRGPPVGKTHIIIETLVAKHSDAAPAKLQDEKGQGIEIHGWGERPSNLNLSTWQREPNKEHWRLCCVSVIAVWLPACSVEALLINVLLKCD